MKRLKLILTAVIAVLFAVSGTKVFADDYTITISGDTTGHTYEAYQIFKGDLNGDTLSNIQWGSGVSPFSYENTNVASEVAEKLTDANAKQFAEEAAKHLTTVTSGNYSNGQITNLEAGYYLIKDKDGSLNNTTGKAYTAYILKVVKNESVKPKTDVPTVTKKVKDTNDTTGVTTDWQDSADYDINDNVPFQLTATLPATNFDEYSNYYLEFSDTMSKGLTFNQDSLIVKVGDRKLVNNEYTLSTEKDSEGKTKIVISIVDVKVLGGVAGGKVTVDYTAKLNSEAIIGSAGNPNEVELIYSNNPNNKGGGKPTTPGRTPKDTVIVFTYKVVVNKINQDKQPLTGAGFTLYKKDSSGTWNKVGDELKDVTKFEFKGLDDGDYKLEETTTPLGYNTIKPIEFTITADHDVISDNPALKSLSGNVKTGEITFTSDTSAGSLTTDVVNKKGSLLPSTGSVGTTLLYITGTILVLFAGILLLTKKRIEVK